MPARRSLSVIFLVACLAPGAALGVEGKTHSVSASILKADRHRD